MTERKLPRYDHAQPARRLRAWIAAYQLPADERDDDREPMYDGPWSEADFLIWMRRLAYLTMQRPSRLTSRTWARRLRDQYAPHLEDHVVERIALRVNQERARWFGKGISKRWSATQARRGRLGAAVANALPLPACRQGGLASGVARRARTVVRDVQVQEAMDRRRAARRSGRGETVAAIAERHGTSRATCYRLAAAPALAGVSGYGHSYVQPVRIRGSGIHGRRPPGGRLRPEGRRPHPSPHGRNHWGPPHGGEVGSLTRDGTNRSQAPPERPGSGAGRGAGRGPPAGSGLERPSDHAFEAAADRETGEICPDCRGLGFVGELGTLEACSCAAGQEWLELRRRKGRP